jgi:hypothetical protein
MVKKNKLLIETLPDILLVGILSLVFIFFAFFYKYHLFYIEQMQLFLFTKDQFLNYIQKPAFLASYLGDFLTQFYYLTGGGALIITSCLALLWWILYKLLNGLMSSKWMFILPSSIIILISLLHLDINYPLASTIAAIISVLFSLGYTFIQKNWLRLSLGITSVPVLYTISGGYFIVFVLIVIFYELKIKKIQPISKFAYLLILSGITALLPVALRSHYYLTKSEAFTYPNIHKINPFPNFYLEKILSLDCEWYFNKPAKVLSVARHLDLKDKYCTYYYNLANASFNQLPDGLMNFYQPGPAGLYIPLNREQNYMSIAFGSNVYYLMGDVNSSQHYSLLGTTFSPKCESSRLLRSLVETNIINREYAAAEKYIKILENTLFHRKWAEKMRTLLSDSASNNCPWIVSKRNQMPVNDFIKDNPNDFENTLKHLIADRPDNQIALNYLLCYYLLNKDLSSFSNIMKEEVKKKKITSLPALYQEALLIYYAQHMDDTTKNTIPFSPDIFKRFVDYTNIYAESSGNGKLLQSAYEKTYWFYYHFAVLKKGEEK